MKPKNPPRTNRILNLINQMKEEAQKWPEVQRRWYIIEYFPPKCIDSHYDDWDYGGWNRVMNITFPTKEAAEEYLSQHEPSDPGGALEIKEEVLRRVTEEKWFPY